MTKSIAKKATNVAGSNKLKSGVIGNSDKSHCFRRINCLPVNYMANKHEWQQVFFSSRLIGEETSMMGKIELKSHGNHQNFQIHNQKKFCSFWKIKKVSVRTQDPKTIINCCVVFNKFEWNDFQRYCNASRLKTPHYLKSYMAPICAFSRSGKASPLRECWWMSHIV